MVDIPHLPQHHSGVQAALDLPARLVVGEPQDSTGGVQGQRQIVRVILPAALRPGRRHPPHPPTQHVERRGHRSTVTRLGQHPTERIPLEHTVRVGAGSAHDTADGVVGERRHRLVATFLNHVSE